MKLNRNIVLTFSLVGLSIMSAFQNCSPSTKFAASSSDTPVGEVIRGPANAITPTPEVLLANEVSPESKLQFFSYQNGQAVADLYLGEVVHGVVTNVDDEDVYGCSTYVDREHECTDHPEVWSKLPVPGWKYAKETRSWLMSENLDYLFVANREFVMLFHDKKNNVKVRGTNSMKPRKVVPSSCQWSAFVIGPTNPSQPTKMCQVSNAWEKAVSSGIEWNCYCPGIPDPNEKTTEMGYIKSISTYSKAYSYYDIVTGNSTRQAPAIGGECVVGVAAEGRLTDCEAEWRGEVPNKYIMCSTWTLECASK